MSTTWPATATQTFSDPASTDKLNSPSHSTLHTNVNDTLEAVETYLGTNASQTTPTGANKVLRATSATASEWGQIVAGDITDATITYAKIQNISATDKVLGRSTAGAGATEEIACTAAGRALIDDADATAQRAT